jgi:hypothetical protein
MNEDNSLLGYSAVQLKQTDVSEVRIACIIRAMPEMSHGNDPSGSIKDGEFLD